MEGKLLPRIGIGLLLVVLGGVGFRAYAASGTGRFVSYRPLTLSELYQKRMRFRAGEPMVSVGLMSGQKRVRIGSTDPLRLMFEEAGVPKKLYAEPGTVFVATVKESKPAKTRFWVVVGQFEYTQLKEAQAAQGDWQRAGYQAHVFQDGLVMALRGNVLDTRVRQVAIGGYSQRRKAQKLVQSLFKKRGLRASVRTEFLRPPQGTIIISDPEGRLLHEAPGLIYFGTIQGGQMKVAEVEHGKGYAHHGRSNRQYWDHIYLALDARGQLAVVNSVGAETLLKGLVPAEIFASAPQEALKAQALTARGEIFSKLGHRHFSDPFHLCSAQHCQVYRGAGAEDPRSSQAVDATRGLVAVRPRTQKDAPLKLVDSVYSSSCGGHTENNEVVWDQPKSDSLRARLDGPVDDPALSAFAQGITSKNIRAWVESYPPTYCAKASKAKASKFRWKKSFDANKLSKIAKKHGLGELKDLRVLSRGPGGRVTGVEWVGTTKNRQILRELPVRRFFGNLNSGTFVLNKTIQKKRLLALEFVGAGWGHGVGMCQMGAIGRAEAGHDFKRILGHYYNGAQVMQIYR